MFRRNTGSEGYTSKFVKDKLRGEIACSGEILLSRVKCFAAQNVKYFICDEMMWTGFARTHYKNAGRRPRNSPHRGGFHLTEISPPKAISPCEARFHWRASARQIPFFVIITSPTKKARPFGRVLFVGLIPSSAARRLSMRRRPFRPWLCNSCRTGRRRSRAVCRRRLCRFRPARFHPQRR